MDLYDNIVKRDENIQFPGDSTFLVTGAARFIGSNLVEAVLRFGYKVRGLDNYSTGEKENLEEFSGNLNFEFVEGDIRNLESCMEICEGVNYDLHQAAWGSVPRSIEMPLLYEEINIKGTFALAIDWYKGNL
jgi:UDP-N-acetylglucosamine 4-epimerase